MSEARSATVQDRERQLAWLDIQEGWSDTGFAELGTHQEEIVGQDGDWEDVDKLPADKAGLGEPGRLDQARVDLGLDADGDGSNDNEADDHCSLDVVGEEGDPKPPDG